MKRYHCGGAIRRYGEDYRCSSPAAYAVKDETGKVVATCRHHVAQVIDRLGAARLVVVRLDATE